jgi:hypothetical protein
LQLIERKRELRSLVPNHFPHLLYVDHVEGVGESLFQLAGERDLEGIVAKHRHSGYVMEDGNPGWVKIRNRRYSQMIGRDELFERNYEAEVHQRSAGMSVIGSQRKWRSLFPLMQLGFRKASVPERQTSFCFGSGKRI